MVYHHQGGMGHPTSLLLPQKLSHTAGNTRILKILGGQSLVKVKGYFVKNKIPNFLITSWRPSSYHAMNHIKKSH